MLLLERRKHADHWESVKEEILAKVRKEIESAYPDGKMPDFIAAQISQYWQAMYKLTYTKEELR